MSLCVCVCVHSRLRWAECTCCLNMSALLVKYMCHMWACLTHREPKAGRRVEQQQLLTRSFSRLQWGSNTLPACLLTRTHAHRHAYTQSYFFLPVSQSCSGGSAGWLSRPSCAKGQMGSGWYIHIINIMCCARTKIGNIFCCWKITSSYLFIACF